MKSIALMVGIKSNQYILCNRLQWRKCPYPVVSTHRIEGVCATDKNHLIVSWNKHFYVVVAFILHYKAHDILEV